jgi:hypothetical protein
MYKCKKTNCHNKGLYSMEMCKIAVKFHVLISSFWRGVTIFS